MKTLGIIGGVGPESTIDYYGSIIAQYRKIKGDGSYPQFLINSIDLKKEVDYVAANDLAGLTAFLVEEIRKLASAGAQFGIIASNTPHIVFDGVRSQSPIPLISIVETAAQAAEKMKLKRVGLMGTRFTMGASFYPDTFSKHGISVVLPPMPDQEYIHDKYMNQLVNGIFLPETHASLTAIIDKLKRTQNVDGVVLGGTELPLILREPAHHGIPILNTTKIHVEAAVAEMLS